MRAVLFILLLAFILAPVATAQSPIVVPEARFATTSGNTNNNIPFSWTPTRYQQIFDNADMGPSSIFRYMQMRPSPGFNKPTYGGKTVELELFAGATTVSYSSPSASFATNNPSPTKVLKKTWVNMPTFTGGPITEWQITIPFDIPYAWAGKNNFCIEAINWQNSNSNSIFTYPLDAASGTRTCRVYASGNPAATSGSIGNGYGIIMRFTMFAGTRGSFTTYGNNCGNLIITSNDTPTIAKTLKVDASGAMSSAPALLIIGNKDTAYGTFKLPLDLSAFGASPCFLNTSIVLLSSTTTTNQGGAQISLPIPNDKAMVGVKLFMQWISTNPKLNSLGINASKGAAVLIGEI